MRILQKPMSCSVVLENYNFAAVVVECYHYLMIDTTCAMSSVCKHKQPLVAHSFKCRPKLLTWKVEGVFNFIMEIGLA